MRPVSENAAQLAATAQLIERRAEPRVAVNTPARLFYGRNLELWLDCLVKDRSPSGAKIQVPAVYRLPHRVVLLDYQQGFAFEASVRWHKAELAGLRLRQVHDFNDPGAPIEPDLKGVNEAWLALAPGIRRVV